MDLIKRDDESDVWDVLPGKPLAPFLAWSKCSMNVPCKRDRQQGYCRHHYFILSPAGQASRITLVPA